MQDISSRLDTVVGQLNASLQAEVRSVRAEAAAETAALDIAQRKALARSEGATNATLVHMQGMIERQQNFTASVLHHATAEHELLRSSLASHSADHNASLIQLQRTVQAQQQNITDLVRVASLDARRVDVLTGNVTALQEQVWQVRGNLSAARMDADAQAADCAAVQAETMQRLANVSNAHAELTARFEAALAAQAQQQQVIEQLQTALTAATASLTNLTSALASLEGSSKNATEEVAQLKGVVASAELNSPLLGNATKQMQSLEYMVAALGRDAVLKAEQLEQTRRSHASSGLATSRSWMSGSEEYMAGTWAAGAWTPSIMSIHDHSDFRDTVGMGELHGVLNGVEFWTRHNDYSLRMPSRSSSAWHATEPLPRPPVPPSVAAAPNVSAQIAEMREYFRAWAEQDESIRPYKEYFRPALCYLEGAWLVDDAFNEPFSSDRHAVEASSWAELYDKARLHMATGWKNAGENIPWLPSRVWSLRDGVQPQMARWSYRILCAPLRGDVPLARFRLAPDLGTQLMYQYPQTRPGLAAGSRAARFMLNGYTGSSASRAESWDYARRTYDFLDSLMEQVPGADNYRDGEPPLPCEFHDPVRGAEHAYSSLNKSAPLNGRFYNRAFRVGAPGAMGQNHRRRGWNDESLWVASTTQEEVAPLPDAQGNPQRLTYAVPLEILFLTPLNTWNPHNITEWPDDEAGEPTRDGREGSATDPAKAFAGVSRRYWYRTPLEFFAGVGAGADAADTSTAAVGVIDPAGNASHIFHMAAAGMWIFLPSITGVPAVKPYAGPRLRLRWPIPPLHVTPRSLWQELKALQMVSSAGEEGSFAVNAGLPGEVGAFESLVLETGSSIATGQHRHALYLGKGSLDALRGGANLTVTTSTDNMHAHDLIIHMLPARPGAPPVFQILACDGRTGGDCAVGHDHSVHLTTRQW